MNDNKIAVIGSGITGLTSAYFLQKGGYKVSIFERRDSVGGAIRTEKQEKWLTEFGPNTILLKDAVVAEFLEEIGLSSEKVVANQLASKRFIVKSGILEPLPTSIISAFKTPLFSFKGKLRVLTEPMISKNENRDQTIAEFVERRLGKEILDYAINPFVAGIFANKPENLSLRHTLPMMDNLEELYGSLIWGSFKGRKERNKNGRIARELISFKDGLHELPKRVASLIDSIYLNHEVTKVSKSEDGWSVSTQQGEFDGFSDVIINAPISKWSAELFPFEVGKFDEVNYPPLSVMHIGYKKSDIDHPMDGFGFLVPEKENRDILGALFSSTLFPGRAPDDCHLLTVFVGGGRQPELAAMDSEQLLNVIEKDLKDFIGLKGKPVFKNHVYWPNSIPAYHVGYDEILQSLLKIEVENPGIHFAGNYRGGVSVPDCIKNGISIAERLSSDSD